jgi:alkaline phosphatase D
MIDLRRRSLLKAGALGAGALAVPSGAFGLTRGFTHGVASGEPRSDSVMLWTRYVPARGDAALIGYEVAEDPGFGRVVAKGDAPVSGENDFCAKATVKGLAPAHWYYYRFTGADHSRSVMGRTRTLPEGRTRGFRIAAFSCANKPFGWFNAYAHAAARNDIDLVVFLGDYAYEYQRGDYPSAQQSLAGRPIEPAGEAYQLDGYRARYASYRIDPDLQRLHQISIPTCSGSIRCFRAWRSGMITKPPTTPGRTAPRITSPTSRAAGISARWRRYARFVTGCRCPTRIMRVTRSATWSR